MLDTHARRFIQPLFNGIADIFIHFGFSPTQVTLVAGAVGLSAGGAILFGLPIMAVFLLWVSGILDAVDGTMARKMNQKTKWGTFLDILSDRAVEIGIILALGFRNPNVTVVLLLLSGAIILSLSAFFTAGTLIDLKTEKSFYYQAGLAERTEGFIFFTIMILWQPVLFWSTLCFAAIVLYTAVQRSVQLYRILH